MTSLLQDTSIRTTTTGQEAGIHDRRSDHAGAGSRRHYGNVFGHSPGPAKSARDSMNLQMEPLPS
jgi:hypothetical protein